MSAYSAQHARAELPASTASGASPAREASGASDTVLAPTVGSAPLAPHAMRAYRKVAARCECREPHAATAEGAFCAQHARCAYQAVLSLNALPAPRAGSATPASAAFRCKERASQGICSSTALCGTRRPQTALAGAGFCAYTCSGNGNSIGPARFTGAGPPRKPPGGGLYRRRADSELFFRMPGMFPAYEKSRPPKSAGMDFTPKS